MSATPSPLHACADSCRECGACVEVCPNDVLEVKDGRARTRIDAAARCIGCGGCVAVCPSRSLSLVGRDSEDFPELEDPPADLRGLRALFDSRRSVRVFRNEPVDRALVRQVLDVAAAAPMGFPPHSTEVLVLDRRADLDQLAREVREGYERLAMACRHPVARQVVRLKTTDEEFHAIRDHVLDVADFASEQFRTAGKDRYTYGAPVVLLFHANRWRIAYRPNAVIVATYAMLAAQALGLGTTLLDIVPPIVNRTPSLKQRLGLGPDDVTVIAMVLGHPKYRYRRGIRRPLASVRFAAD